MIDLNSERNRFFKDFKKLKNHILENEKIKSINEIYQNSTSNFITDVPLDWEVISNLELASQAEKSSGLPLGILFVHFTGSHNEFDSYDFPFLMKQLYPNYRVFISRIKSIDDCKYWELTKDKKIVNVQESEVAINSDILLSKGKSIDILAMRDSRFKSNNKVRINCSPMGFKSTLFSLERKEQYVFRDYHKPVSPIFLNKTIKMLSLIKKEKIILIAGPLNQLKNQIYFIENVNPETIKGYSILFIGDCSSSYATKVKKISDRKKLNTYFIGKVNNDFVHYFYCIAALHALNSCVSKYEPNLSYDADTSSISKAIASNCLNIVSNEVLNISDQKKYCFIYELDKNNFNEVLFELVSYYEKNKDKINFNKNLRPFEVIGIQLINNIFSLLL